MVEHLGQKKKKKFSIMYVPRIFCMTIDQIKNIIFISTCIIQI